MTLYELIDILEDLKNLAETVDTYQYDSISDYQDMAFSASNKIIKTLLELDLNKLEAGCNELVGEIKVLKKALEFGCGIADCNWCIYANECDTEVIGCAELILQKAKSEIEQEERK